MVGHTLCDSYTIGSHVVHVLDTAATDMYASVQWQADQLRESLLFSGNVKGCCV